MKFITDEDFNNRVLRGLFLRFPLLDVVRVQDVGLREKPDWEILEWAAQENRLLLTHDFSTMIDFAYERVDKGLDMPGIVAVRQRLPIGETIEELSLFIECSLDNEWENQVAIIPL